MPLKKQWNQKTDPEATLKESLWLDHITAPEFSDTLFLGFSSYQDRIAQGELISFYLKKSCKFYSLDQLIFAIEDFIDQAGFPKPAVGHRKLERDEEISNDSNSSPKNSAAAPLFIEWEKQHPPSLRGKLCIACVRVYFRQHASMQGELKVSHCESVRFRSALELMHLLQDALTSVTK